MDIHISSTSESHYGAEGGVWFGTDQLGQKLAIKFLHFADVDVNERLRAMAVKLAKLNHVNVVRIYGILPVKHPNSISAELVPALVLEHVNGPTFSKWMSEPRSREDILSKLICMASGLKAFHGASLAHGDINPANVVVTEVGAKLIDPAPSLNDAEDPDGIVKDVEALKALVSASLAKVTGTTQFIGGLYSESLTSASAVLAMLESLRTGQDNLGEMGVGSNPFFVGREELLENAWRLSHERDLAVIGAGGIGKTEFAARFAIGAIGYFSTVWWLQGANRSIFDELLRFCARFGKDVPPGVSMEDLCRVARSIISDLNALIILDDVEDPAVAVRLRSGRRARILYTTRRADVPAIFAPIAVGELEDSAATALLLHQRPDIVNDAHLPDVLTALGNHPLALALAATYLGRRPTVGLNEFFTRLTRAEIGSKDNLFEGLDPQVDVGTGYKLKVARAVSLHFENLGEKGTALIEELAFCAADGTPISLVRALGRQRGDTSEAADDVCLELARFSLVEFKSLVRIHALTQSAVRARLSDEQRQTILKAVAAGLTSLGSEPDAAREGLTPTIMSVVHWGKDISGDERFVPLATHAADFLQSWSYFDEALDALTVADQNCSDDNNNGKRGLVIIRVKAARIYRDLSMPQEATEVLDQAQEIASGMSGDVNELHAELFRERGEIAQMRGRNKEAVAFFNKAIACELALGRADGISTLACQSHLAVQLANDGKIKEAEALIKDVLAADKRTGRDESVTQHLMCHAQILVRKRDIDGAVGLFNQCLDRMKAQPLRMKSTTYTHCLSSLGYAYMFGGQFEEAAACHDRARQAIADTLGIDHLDYGIALSNLGSVEVSRKNFDQAIELFFQAKDIIARRVGEDHYLIATQLNNLGSTMVYKGDIEQGIAFLKESYLLLFDLDGPEAFSVARAAFGLQLMGVDIASFTERRFGYLKRVKLLRTLKEHRAALWNEVDELRKAGGRRV